MSQFKKTKIVKGIVSLSSEHAITITLHPKMYCMDPIMQRNAIQGIINSFREDCHMSLICELTPHGQNIHLHGTIKVPLIPNKTVDYIVHNKFRSIKDIGFICVKQIEDYDGWQDYCIKEMQITRDNLNENPVIIDDNGFFSPLVLAAKLDKISIL